MTSTPTTIKAVSDGDSTEQHARARRTAWPPCVPARPGP